jgi:hypothetical protein
MQWTLASQIGPSHRRFGRWSLRSAREEPDVDAQLTQAMRHIILTTLITCLAVGPAGPSLSASAIGSCSSINSDDLPKVQIDLSSSTVRRHDLR